MANAAASSSAYEAAAAAAEELVRRAPQDIVFQMAVIGETREILRRFFEKQIEAEIERRGGSMADALARPFVDEHAARLRDFVLTGVSLSRQFRLEDIEALLGDRTMLTRVDLWDSFTSHIETALSNFQAEAGKVSEMLASLESARAEAQRR